MSEQIFGDVGVTRHGHVAVVEMRRPPHNFFDVQLVSQLADAFEALDADDGCRALVLAAQGKSFCAGANFDQNSLADYQTGGRNALYDEAYRLFACAKPVVSAVQGAAIGGGLGVAMVGDFRVASPESRFSASFVKLGIHPGFGLTHTLPRAMGAQKAALLFLTGRRLDGQTALDWGLVDVLVPNEQIRDAALKLAAEIAENAPLAVVSTRKTLRQGLADAVRTTADHEHIEQTWLAATADHEEGKKAVAERRPGVFTNR